MDLCDCCQRFKESKEYDTPMGKRFYCDSCADDMVPVDEQHEYMMAGDGPEDYDE